MHPSHQPVFHPEPGAIAPLFHGECGSNPRYAVGSAAGRYLLLAFIGSHDHPEAQQTISALKTSKAFDDRHASAFAIWADGRVGTSAISKPRLPGIRHFNDKTGDIFSLYRLAKTLPTPADGRGQQLRISPCLILLDPMLRVLKVAPLEEVASCIQVIEAMPAPKEHAQVCVHAPILIIPRVFEEDFCQELIAYYKRTGAEYSGVMSEKDGKTVYVENPSFKVRFDCQIEDASIRDRAKSHIQRRLVPMLYRALNFEATRMERYIVACYTKDKGGFFLPHRDNTTRGTAHRAFAVSINLNTGDFDGGGLRFPEFSDQVYTPPRGGAVVFGCSLLHEATPVTAGNRYVFLPFLYDEVGAKRREENAHYLDAGVPGYSVNQTQKTDQAAERA